MDLSNFFIDVFTKARLLEGDRLVLRHEQNSTITINTSNGTYVATLDETVKKCIIEHLDEYSCHINQLYQHQDIHFLVNDGTYVALKPYKIQLHMKKNRSHSLSLQKPTVFEGLDLVNDGVFQNVKKLLSSKDPAIVKFMVPMGDTLISAYQPLLIVKKAEQFTIENTPNSQLPFLYSFFPEWNNLLNRFFPFEGGYEKIVLAGGYKMRIEKSTADTQKEKEAVNRRFGIDESDQSFLMKNKKSDFNYKDALSKIYRNIYYVEIAISNVPTEIAMETLRFVEPKSDSWESLAAYTWMKRTEIKSKKKNIRQSILDSDDAVELGMWLELGQQEHERKIVSGEYETYDSKYDRNSSNYMNDDERYIQRVRDGEE